MDAMDAMDATGQAGTTAASLRRAAPHWGSVDPTMRGVVADRRVVVCLGAGGVGKTTVAAAIAAQSASDGRHVLCLTIDPARRLAESLGIEPGDGAETPVPEDRLRRAGLPPLGSLAFSQLDARRTFEGVVRRTAPDAGAADRVIANPLYRYFARSIAGLQEFMAMERLFAVRADPRYDLVVVDTPPTSNALDFLDAPRRMIEALDSPFMTILAGGSASQVAGLTARGARMAFRALARMAGRGMLEQVSSFLADSQGLLAGFRARAVDVDDALRSGDVAHVVVTTPEPQAVDEAIFLQGRLGTIAASRDAFVVNLVRSRFAEPTGRPEARAGTVPPELLSRLHSNLARQNRLADADEAEIARLARRCGPERRYYRLGLFDAEVHDLHAVAAAARELFAPEAVWRPREVRQHGP